MNKFRRWTDRVEGSCKVWSQKSRKMTGHVWIPMTRIPQQAIRWEFDWYGRRPGQPGRKWLDTVKNDLLDVKLIWQDSEEFAANEYKWHWHVMQHVFHVGWVRLGTKFGFDFRPQLLSSNSHLNSAVYRHRSSGFSAVIMQLCPFQICCSSDPPPNAE